MYKFEIDKTTYRSAGQRITLPKISLYCILKYSPMFYFC